VKPNSFIIQKVLLPRKCRGKKFENMSKEKKISTMI